MPSFHWTGYDEIAETYASVAERLFFAAPARDLASLLHTARGGSALDIGTGSGAVAVALRHSGGGRVFAVDPAVSMLRIARDRASGVQFAAAVLPELPFRSEIFDAATLGFVLSHIADIVGALGEVRRLLKRGGHVALSAWSTGPAATPPGCAWQQVAHEFVPANELEQVTSRYLPSEAQLSSPAGAIDVLRKAGFQECRAELRSYPIVAGTDEYIDTRLISISSRYLYFKLPRPEWVRFVAKTRETLKARFGEMVTFESSVNLAVGVTRTSTKP